MSTTERDNSQVKRTSTFYTNRTRRHNRDDHSMCEGWERCETVTRQSSRGNVLADALLAERTRTAAERDVIVEIGRIADRLDQLHEQLQGRAPKWITGAAEAITRRIEGYAGDVDVLDVRVRVTAEVDSVLQEIRSQENTYKALVGELRQQESARARADGGTDAPPKPAPAPSPTPTAGGDLDFGLLARRRAARG